MESRFKPCHLLIVFLLCGVSALPAQVVYKDFGPPPGVFLFGNVNTFVSAINGSGDIVGYFTDRVRNDHSFLISGGSFYEINFPGVASTRVLAINNSGEMAGYFYGSDNKYHGFLLSGSGGTFTQIDSPGSDRGTFVTAMNDSGQIVGWYRDAARNDHSFLLSGGVYATIDAPGADQGTYTTAINNSGQILGYFADSGGVYGYEQHGYLLSTKSVFTQIDGPGFIDITGVIGLNASGTVLAYVSGSDHHSHYFLFSNGSYTSINPPAPYSGADFLGINDLGQIVGLYQNCDPARQSLGLGSSCGLLLSENTYTKVSPPGSSNINLQAINDSGRMVGVFYDASGVHVYEADPMCVDAGGDTDGDGLCDDWEREGIKDEFGNMLLDLPALGADPKHKDLFVEIDYMDCQVAGSTCAPGDTHNHRPLDTALIDVIQAFVQAPCSNELKRGAWNPDGTCGVKLHVFVDEPVPHHTPIRFDNHAVDKVNGVPVVPDGEFDDLKLGNPRNPCGIATTDGHFGRLEDRKQPNCDEILQARRLVYRYAIYGHDHAHGIGSSGISELPGNDFMVTLGGWSDDDLQSGGGQQVVEAGTFMHELGHTLNLRHGGGDDVNCKPNYLSVMNYTLQTQDLDPIRPLDYSRAALSALDENNLDESLGISGPKKLLTVFGVSLPKGDFTRYTAAAGPIDWNLDGTANDSGLALQVNRIKGINDCFATATDGTPIMKLQTLAGYDDWSNLLYNFRNSPDFDDGVPRTTVPTENEITNVETVASAAALSTAVGNPITQVAIMPQPNIAGWNNTNVTVSLSATDTLGAGVQQISYNASGAQNISNAIAQGASAAINLTAEGKTTITYFATDVAGNAESPHMLTVQIDKTPPTITATATPPPNIHGWNNTDVTVSYACSDSLSGLAPSNPPAATVLSSEGIGQSVTGTCTDIAGNSSSATVNNINIDKTPPTIVGSRIPLANANGWNNSDVTVSFACSDSLSGIDTCGPENQIVSAEGTHQSRTATAVDLAGNTASTTVSGIDIDKTPPTMNCKASPNVLWPPNHKLVTIATNVLVSDSLSGPAGFALLSLTNNEPDSGMGDIQGWLLGEPSVNGQLRAERLGTGMGRVYTFVYRGTDQAGNAATCVPTVIVPHDQGH